MNFTPVVLVYYFSTKVASLVIYKYAMPDHMCHCVIYPNWIRFCGTFCIHILILNVNHVPIYCVHDLYCVTLGV